MQRIKKSAGNTLTCFWLGYGYCNHFASKGEDPQVVAPRIATKLGAKHSMGDKIDTRSDRSMKQDRPREETTGTQTCRAGKKTPKQNMSMLSTEGLERRHQSQSEIWTPEPDRNVDTIAKKEHEHRNSRKRPR